MIVTLLTDFELVDTYVGQLKGAVLAVAPGVQLVDLTHRISAQDVQSGAFLLWGSVDVFPAGSIHLAVVDPGVGSDRRGVAARTLRGDMLVGPDNGLLWPAVERLGGLDLAISLANPRYWRPTPSATFHGRDIFGPVAGHLAAGVHLEDLGPRVDDLVRLELPRATQSAGRIRGEVFYIDAYGNLITNIAASDLPPTYRVIVDGEPVPSATFYAQVKPGKLLAIVGSFGLLEISARDESAAVVASAYCGTPVEVEF